MSERTLAEDEQALSEYAEMLRSAIDACAVPWLGSLIERHAPGLASRADVAAGVRSVATQLRDELGLLLGADIAEQTIGPLELLRRAVAYPTEVLASENVAPVERDPFARRNFPDDVYNLTPASFAEIDPSLHEPGLVWGAAKAHVHLRRRRKAQEAEQLQEADEADAAPAPHVVVLSVDLMDRSKISAAYPEATIVRSLAKLAEAATASSLVFVDLGRLDDVTTELARLPGQVVAYGSHVADDVLAAAEAAGAEALPRSVFFRRLEQTRLG